MRPEPGSAGVSTGSGDGCTIEDQCDGGGAASAPRWSNDGNECTVDLYDHPSGCAFIPVENLPCVDGNDCTVGDACSAAGACVSGPAPDCDDDNECTTDTCHPFGGCANNVLNGVSCDDGDACTKLDVCSVGVCAGKPKVCVDGDACTVDTCQSSLGCVFHPIPGCG